MADHELSIVDQNAMVRSGKNSCADCKFSDYSASSYPTCRAVFKDGSCRHLDPTGQCVMWRAESSRSPTGIDLGPIAWCGFWIMFGLIFLGAGIR